MPGMKIGVDFGSSSFIMYVEGKGVVVDEPSVIAVDIETGKPIAIGSAAYNIYGRNPDTVEVIHPVCGGVISNYKMAGHVLKFYLQKICGNSIFKPNLMSVIPSGATNLEKRTLADVMTSAGAGKVCLLEESLASAIGNGIDNTSLTGRLLVNMGGGAVDVSIVTMGAVAVAKSVKTGGLAADAAIMRYLKRERDILIGPLTAERLKICLGSAVPRREEIAVIAAGKSSLDNMPISFEVTSTEIYGCIADQIKLMVRGIKALLEKTPPELAGDIADNGIVLTGGTSLLYGMDKFIAAETGIETTVADDSFYCTARGAGAAIKNMELLNNGGMHVLRTVHSTF